MLYSEFGIGVIFTVKNIYQIRDKYNLKLFMEQATRP